MMKEDVSVKQRRKAEIILIASLLLVGLFACLLIFIFRTEGAFVSVSVNGELYAEYSLAHDGVYDIGEGNTLTVEDGYAYMSHADCPDGLCVKTGKISAVGEHIVCLPNRVMAQITEGREAVP